MKVGQEVAEYFEDLPSILTSKLIRTDAELDHVLLSGSGARVQTINLHHLYLASVDPKFRESIAAADFVTADGWPVKWLVSPLAPSVSRVTGSEFVERLLAGETQPKRLALVGASERAGAEFEKLATAAGHLVVYREHGQATEWDAVRIARDLRERQADVVLVAVTPPLGELFAHQLTDARPQAAVIAVGGSIDMVTGLQVRAPAWAGRLRLEWLHRLAGNPRRLTRRYLMQCAPAFARFVVPARRRHARRIAQLSTPVTVAHIGISGDRPGGMAQVVNEYLSWEPALVQQYAILSTRGKRDPLSLVLGPIAALRLALLRLRKRPSVAVFHLSEDGSFLREGALLRLAASMGIRTIAHIHGANFDEFARTRPVLARGVLARANQALVLSERSMAALRALEIDSIRVNNPVYLPSAIAEKEKLIVFCGELSERKGVDVLVAAWRRVATDMPDWELVLAGPSTLSVEVPSDLHRVSVVGPLSHSDAMALCDRASIAVLPSRDEALPMFLLEAMARGCFSIGTPVGHVSDLLADGAGALVRVGDAADLAAALTAATEDHDVRASTAAKGRARVEAAYSSTVVREHLEEVWSSVALGQAS